MKSTKKVLIKRQPAKRDAVAAVEPQPTPYVAAQSVVQAQLQEVYGPETLALYNEMRAKEAHIMAAVDGDHTSYTEQATYFTHVEI